VRQDVIPAKNTLPYAHRHVRLQPAPPAVPYRRFLTPRQRREQLPANDAAARVAGAAKVAREATFEAQCLALQKARAHDSAPHGADAYDAFFEAFVGVAYNEIARLCRDGEE
jgi:hypothetical protein